MLRQKRTGGTEMSEIDRVNMTALSLKKSSPDSDSLQCFDSRGAPLEKAGQHHHKISQPAQQAFDALVPIQDQTIIQQTVLAVTRAQMMAERDGYLLAGKRVIDRRGRSVPGWLGQNGIVYDQHGYLVELPIASAPAKKVHYRWWAWLKHFWLGID